MKLVRLARYLFVPKAYYVYNERENIGEIVESRSLSYKKEITPNINKIESNHTIKNWFLLAAIVDRFLFCLYAVLNILVAVFIFVKPSSG